MIIPNKCDYCNNQPSSFFIIVNRGLKGKVIDGKTVDFHVYGTCASHQNRRDIANSPETLKALRTNNIVHIFDSIEELITFSVLND